MKSTNDKIDNLRGLTHLGYEPDWLRFKQEIRQLIKETLLEVLGEEETPEIPINDYHWRIRNQLRQQALTKLDDLLK